MAMGLAGRQQDDGAVHTETEAVWAGLLHTV